MPRCILCEPREPTLFISDQLEDAATICGNTTNSSSSSNSRRSRSWRWSWSWSWKRTHSSHIGLKDFDNKQHERWPPRWRWKMPPEGSSSSKSSSSSGARGLHEGRTRAHSLITRALIINFSTAAQLEAVSLILLQVPKSIWYRLRPWPRTSIRPRTVLRENYKVSKLKSSSNCRTKCTPSCSCSWSCKLQLKF